MTSVAAKVKEPITQEVCIDLPGETVQCWRSGEKLKVILRKHRDVILDLNLGHAKTYTVHATKSDFYNARDKKLVYRKRHDVVSFADGERLRLWITRGFKGSLVVECEGRIIVKITPSEIDPHVYDETPKTKPAPIIIALGKSSTPVSPVPKSNSTPLLKLPAPAAAPVDEECAIVCVVDGTVKGMPDHIAQFFAKGGGDSGLAEIDPYKIPTRNWIWGQVAALGDYVGDNWKWLRESLDSRTHSGFRLVKAQVHLVRGKVRFYFSGFSKYNTVFGPGGFGPSHDRIMSIFAGAGKTKSSFTAVAKGVAGTFKGYAAVSFIFGAATSYAEWKDDAKKDGYDFAVSFVLGVLKSIISAAIAVAVVAALVMFIMVFFEIAVSVMVVGFITICIGTVVGYAVEAADRKLGQVVTGDKTNTDGSSSFIAPYVRKFGSMVESSWAELMKKFPADYVEIKF